MICGRVSHRLSRFIFVGSVLRFFSIWSAKPRPGGVMLKPFWFLNRNFPSAISSRDGIAVLFLAGMNAIVSFRPLRCSGR